MKGLFMKYFVLNPNKDDEYGIASRRAIMAYAHSIGINNKKLADDLIRWVNIIDEKRLCDFERKTRKEKK